MLACLLISILIALPLPAQTVAGALSRPGFNPTALAVYQAGNKIFAADGTTQRIHRFDGQTLAELDSVAAGPFVYSMALHEGSGRLYAHSRGGAVTVINAMTGALHRTYSGYQGVGELVIDESAGSVWAASQVSGVRRISIANDAETPIPSINVGALFTIAVNPVTHEVFFTSVNTSILSIINPTSLAVTPVNGIGATGLAVNWAGNKVYAGWPSNRIYHRESGQITLIGMGGNQNDATRLTYHPGSNRVYTDAEVNSQTSIIDGVSNAVWNLPIGDTASAKPAIRNSSNHVYFAGKSRTLILEDSTQLFKIIPVSNNNGGGILIQDIAIHQASGRVYVINDSRLGVVSVIQDEPTNCISSISPATGIVGANGFPQIPVSVTINPATCSWSVAEPAPHFITGGSPVFDFSATAVRTGSGSASIGAFANTSASARTGMLSIAGQPFAATQQGTSCGYSLSASGATQPAGGGSGTVNINTGAGCAWSVANLASWVTIVSGASGTGSATVTYSASANPGAARSAILHIAGQNFTVQQAEPQQPPGLRFVPMNPCRVMETRAEYNFEGRTGPFGPPFLNAMETRTLNLPQSNVCAIPANARAYVLNVTLATRGPIDFVTVWPAGDPRPDFWTARSPDGQIVANSAIVRAGTSGGISVFTSNEADLIIDISGYFTDDAQLSNLSFFPMTPCRVIETRIQYRTPAGPFGPPSMGVQETRRFRFPSSPHCSIPANARAYSVTLTAVPPGPLPFLTAWPAGQSRPNISSLNSFTGRILANSLILPASSDGSIDVFAFAATDFLIDINGYFAPDDGQNGLLYYPVTQCRASNSTDASLAFPFGGPIFESATSRSLAIPSAPRCTGIPTTARAYALGATSISGGSPMPFLTAWPTGEARPNASILNAFDGQTITNSAIISASASGSIDIFAFERTHVVVEISGYFRR